MSSVDRLVLHAAVLMASGLVSKSVQADTYDAPLSTDSVSTLAGSVQNDLVKRSGAHSIDGTAINGGGEVSPSGSFTYSIPIELPRGVGIQPSLSLAYDSQAPNGIAGVGWSLAGLSTIERVDGGDGINFTGNHDTFAFNRNGIGGEPDPRDRLVPLASTAPGAERGAYHTVAESWINFVPNGTCGNGPCYWSATDANGTVYYYGLKVIIDDSTPVIWERDNGSGRLSSGNQFKPHGIAVWALSRVMDVHGNYYDLRYLYGSFGQLYPSYIRYTMNQQQTVFRDVSFDYEPRSDVTRVPSPFTLRLKGVSVKAAGALVRKYVLTYEPPPTNAPFHIPRSRLSTIQEIGTDGTTALPPYKFNYSDSQDGSSAVIDFTDESLKPTFTTRFGGYPSFQPSMLGDINGDGRADLVMVQLYDKMLVVQYALGDGPPESGRRLRETVLHTTIQVDAEATGRNAYLADVNGDGLRDLVVFVMGARINGRYGVQSFVANGAPGGLLPLHKGPALGNGNGSIPDSLNLADW